MNVGVLGGAFNPIHIGHIYIAYEAIHILDLDEIWFVPSGNPPHKKIKPSLLRITLIREAMKFDSRFVYCPYEVHKKTTTYTYNTLKYLENKHPRNKFILLIGSDQADVFDTWYKHEELLQEFPVKVWNRTGKAYYPKFKGMSAVHIKPMHISSTKIKELVKENL